MHRGADRSRCGAIYHFGVHHAQQPVGDRGIRRAGGLTSAGCTDRDRGGGRPRRPAKILRGVERLGAAADQGVRLGRQRTDVDVRARPIADAFDLRLGRPGGGARSGWPSIRRIRREVHLQKGDRPHAVPRRRLARGPERDLDRAASRPTGDYATASTTSLRSRSTAAGRVYVAWSRLLGLSYETTVLSSSGDGGRTWSTPHVVDRKLSYPQWVSADVRRWGAVSRGRRCATRSLAGTLRRRGTSLHRETGRAVGAEQCRRTACATGSTCSLNRPSPASAPIRPSRSDAVEPTSRTPRFHRTRRGMSASRSSTPSSGCCGVDASAPPKRSRRTSSGPLRPSTRKRASSGPASTTRPATRSGRTRGSCVPARGTVGTGRSRSASRDSPKTHSCSGRMRSGPVSVTQIAYGSYPGIVAAEGVAHPMWIDARDRSHLDQEIFTARVSSASLSASAR